RYIHDVRRYIHDVRRYIHDVRRYIHNVDAATCLTFHGIWKIPLQTSLLKGYGVHTFLCWVRNVA
ncbi:hypothetical protein, partial [Anabaena sp. CCY 9402-a]|uniref:hypothetical protein n=1 Tax=Anabaena sp. CCY 9402-a TaxID=3103867 RepID=UPI0039C6549E